MLRKITGFLKRHVVFAILGLVTLIIVIGVISSQECDDSDVNDCKSFQGRCPWPKHSDIVSFILSVSLNPDHRENIRGSIKHDLLNIGPSHVGTRKKDRLSRCGDMHNDHSTLDHLVDRIGHFHKSFIPQSETSKKRKRNCQSVDQSHQRLGTVLYGFLCDNISDSEVSPGSQQQPRRSINQFLLKFENRVILHYFEHTIKTEYVEHGGPYRSLVNVCERLMETNQHHICHVIKKVSVSVPPPRVHSSMSKSKMCLERNVHDVISCRVRKEIAKLRKSIEGDLIRQWILAGKGMVSSTIFWRGYVDQMISIWERHMTQFVESDLLWDMSWIYDEVDLTGLGTDGDQLQEILILYVNEFASCQSQFSFRMSGLISQSLKQTRRDLVSYIDEALLVVAPIHKPIIFEMTRSTYPTRSASGWSYRDIDRPGKHSESDSNKLSRHRSAFVKLKPDPGRSSVISFTKSLSRYNRKAKRYIDGDLTSSLFRYDIKQTSYDMQ